MFDKKNAILSVDFIKPIEIERDFDIIDLIGVMTLKNLILSIKHNITLVAAVIVFLSSIAFAVTSISVLGIGLRNDQTSVGFVFLGGVDETKYEAVLQEKIGLWKTNSEYRLEFQGYSYEINLSLFEFDAITTLSSIKKNQTNQAFFTLTPGNQTSLINQFSLVFSEGIASHIMIDKLLDDILSDMGNLITFRKYALKDYLPEDLKTMIGDEVVITNLSDESFAKFDQNAYTIAIQPKSRFSLLETFSKSSLGNEELSIVASAMQKLLRNTPMSNYIFSQNSSLPVWAEPGMNVRILKVNQFDFTFYNPLDYELNVTITEDENNTLRFALNGFPFISVFSTEIEVLTIIPYQDIYVEDDTVDENTPGAEMMSETDTDITYRVKISNGLTGSIKAYYRTETTLSQTTEVIRLYDEESLPVNQIYHYNVITKGGE